MIETVTKVGNVTKDKNGVFKVKVRYFDSGKSKTEFEIAVTTWDETTRQKGKAAFYKVEVWNNPALAEQLKNGGKVLVIGDYDENDWTPKEGSPRTDKIINAHYVNNLTRNAELEALFAEAAG